MDVTDIVKLEDKKEYLVAGKVNHKGKDYMCFVELENQKNVRCCYLDNDEIVFLANEKIDNIILLKLFSQMTKTLNEMAKQE